MSQQRPESRSPNSASHKLWGGRFAARQAAALEALNRSITVDFRLWEHDVRSSRAWTVALWNAGVLTFDESRLIEQGLDSVAARLRAGAQPVESDEDVHTMIDRMLNEEIGGVSGKLHTGRSRNDQVATASRLWTVDACAALDEAVRALQQVMVEHAESLHGLRAIMPGYTHLQRAIPVSAAHWMLSHFWPLERDRQRLTEATRSASTLPLGSGAIAGCAFPVSRVLLQGSLGFGSLSQNSMDAVSDRDFVAQTLFALSMLGVHLSRLAEDLILFGSSEFGFVQFGDAFSTGSSMMPQKRNPDALELARQSGARMLGDLTALLATIKSLPTGYNKDIQEDKRLLFDAVDGMMLVLPAVAGAIAEITFRPERMRAAVSSTMMATDLADYLVQRGVTFREAHGIIGRLVREAEEREAELHTLPFRTFQAAHPAFDQDVYDALSPTASVERREVEGGTGPEAVATQIASARTALRSVHDIVRDANDVALYAHI